MDDDEEEEQIQGLLELAADAAAFRYHADVEDDAVGGTSSKTNPTISCFSSLFGKISFHNVKHFLANLYFLPRSTLERTEGNARLVERQVTFFFRWTENETFNNFNPIVQTSQLATHQFQ